VGGWSWVAADPSGYGLLPHYSWQPGHPLALPNLNHGSQHLNRPHPSRKDSIILRLSRGPPLSLRKDVCDLLHKPYSMYSSLTSTKLSIMCQQLIHKTSFRCGHDLDAPARTVPYQGCGGCGIVRKVEHLGKTTKREPCDDCIADGVWVKNAQNKWTKA